MNRNISEVYLKRTDLFSRELEKAKTFSWLISCLRLIDFVATIAIVVYAVKLKNEPLGYLALGVGGTLFFIMMLIHNDLFEKVERLKYLLDINKKGVDRFNDQWHSFEDTGEEFIDDDHTFTSDLDIFGKASLFQYTSTARTTFGRRNLADKLSGTIADISLVVKRQEAVNELAEKIEFRQNCEAAGMAIDFEDPDILLKWLGEESQIRFSTFSALFIKLLPLFSLMVLVLDIFFIEGRALTTITYLVQFLLYALYYRKAVTTFSVFDRQKKTLQAYLKLIQNIEQEEFTSEFLRAEQKRFRNPKGTPATQAFKALSGILERAELRYNALVHFIINLFTLWDIRCLIDALNWKHENHSSVSEWLVSVGEIEALSSLAQLAHDHPTWSTPEISDELGLRAENVMHPLIGENENIGNDFAMDEQCRVSIISGSNMSGKSTFLRTIATNMILAYAGAPTAADSFSTGVFDIVTSLRTADAVDKKVSTFYAELLRIKKMLDSVRDGRKTFFLIDEIFSGTNSEDRIKGAFTVLKELHAPNCLGMISTHDLELCTLSDDTELNFSNFHFREEFEENDITFDYRIYSGPSTTRNATYLMNIIGIPVDPAV